jgi:hypothetical protein
LACRCARLDGNLLLRLSSFVLFVIPARESAFAFLSMAATPFEKRLKFFAMKYLDASPLE